MTDTGQQPADHPWTRTAERNVWRACKSGLVLTVGRRIGGGWVAEVAGPGVSERSDPFGTRLQAQRWAEDQAADTRRPGAIAGTLGPFETEREAREVPAVRAVYDAFDAAPGVGKMAPHNYLMLVRACEAAGTDLGSASSYDRQILAWLSGWEPQTCAVIAGLISRANLAGVVFTVGQEAIVGQALADAEMYRRDRASAWCGDCQQHPAGACPDHVDDLDAADAYRDLAAQLASLLPQPPEGGAR